MGLDLHEALMFSFSNGICTVSENFIIFTYGLNKQKGRTTELNFSRRDYAKNQDLYERFIHWNFQR